MIVVPSPRTQTQAASSAHQSTVHRIINTARQRTRATQITTDATTHSAHNATLSKPTEPNDDTIDVPITDRTISSPIATGATATAKSPDANTTDANANANAITNTTAKANANANVIPNKSSSSSRVDDILSFIAAADKRTAEQSAIITRTTIQSQSTASQELHALSTDSTITSASEQTQPNNSFKAIRDKLIALTTAVNTHEKTIKQQSEELKRMDEDHRRILKEKQETFEVYLQKQLTFIDSLLSDKTSLQSQIERLSQTLSQSQQLHIQELNTIKKNDEIEKNNLIIQLENREQIKRSEWQRNERKRLKESTLRQLESDMMTLVTSHKERERKISEAYEQKLHEQIQEKEKEFLNRLETVRKNSRVEYDLELQSKEKQYQTQYELIKLDTIQQINTQAKLVENELSQKINQLNQQIQQLSLQHNLQIEQIKKDHIQLIEQNVADTIRLEKEKYEILLSTKNTEWNDILKNQELLRQQQTEKEIKLIVNKLMIENMNAMKQSVMDYENKIRLLQNEMENKLMDEHKAHTITKQNLFNLNKNQNSIELELNKTLEKYQHTSLALSEKEKLILTLTTELDSMKTELIKIKRDYSLSETELNNQWKSKCTALEYQLRQAQVTHEQEMSTLRADGQRQSDTVRDEWRIHITSLIAKKDALIDNLTAQLTAQQRAVDNIAEMNAADA